MRGDARNSSKSYSSYIEGRFGIFKFKNIINWLLFFVLLKNEVCERVASMESLKMKPFASFSQRCCSLLFVLSSVWLYLLDNRSQDS